MNQPTSTPGNNSVPPTGAAHHPAGAGLALAALGVVFGDIGTSPLYALKECVSAEHGVPPTPENILGLLSLIFWSLTMVVSVKYLGFILRADNHGEGGILALLALCPKVPGEQSPRFVGKLGALVIFGAALLYGDGIITPAISVLSAVEGLEVATDSLKPVVVPLTCIILVGLFWFQKFGTDAVGKVFGPVMLVWFLTLAAMGLYNIVDHPSVLVALSPTYAVQFFLVQRYAAFVVMGGVVLVVTGGEALYADMGHFGRRPITQAWFALVMPALVICYFGQGALLIEHPEAAENPFFSMVPRGILTYLLAAIATVATVIASQALISGAFSLTAQAVQLGYFPRITVKHTNKLSEGQIYVPEVNAFLMVSCIALVLAFRTSSSLAAAYGIAVTGTMAITSVVYYSVTRHAEGFGWKWWQSGPLVVLFLAFDLTFMGANLLKFWDGGYVPVVVGVAIFTAMVTWKRGRGYLGLYIKANTRPQEDFLAHLEEEVPVRVTGTAVFLSSNSDGIPPIMAHHVRHNRVLHENIILFTTATQHVPKVRGGSRIAVTHLGKGFHRVVANVGFMEQVNVPGLLKEAEEALLGAGHVLDLSQVTYYLGRETFVGGKGGKMGPWAEGLFAFLSRNARTATSYFSIPPDRVVELGMQLDL